MLTFRQLDDLPDSVVKIMAQTEQAIIDDMARRIAKTGSVTTSAEWQAVRLVAIGTQQQHLLTELSNGLHKSEQELIRLFDEAATRTLASDDKLYRAAGYSPIPLAENAYMQQIIRAGLIKTNGEYRNLTSTTANTATKQFEDALDLAYHKIVSGGFSYQQAIRHAVRSLSGMGLGVIRYPTGHMDYLDVAFRRATLTGVNQTCAELQLRRMDEMGTDLVETTAHHGARPSHAVWQGKWFSRSGQSNKYPEFISSTGYGTGDGLCGWNCRHSFFPVIEGLSDPDYSAEKLREYNNQTVEYDGQQMSLYDATQQQRYIERQIRRWKRESSAMDAAGLDNSQAAGKVREWQARQRDFIKQTGLRRDYFRERAGGQNLEMPRKSGILKLNEAGRKSLAAADYESIKGFRFSDLAVREWYNAHVKSISGQIDKSQPLEVQARQAHGLRNQYREQARNLMADQAKRKRLDVSEPCQSFEEFVKQKMAEKGMSRQQVLEYMISSAVRTNTTVNKNLGLEE